MSIEPTKSTKLETKAIANPDTLIATVRMIKAKSKPGGDLIAEVSRPLLEEFCGSDYKGIHFNLMDVICVEEGKVEQYEKMMKQTTNDIWFPK